MRLARLQRLVGNTAVRRLLTGPPASPAREYLHLQRFVPTDAERDAVSQAFDSLLGAGADPHGLRGTLTASAASLASLQQAVTTIVATVAVPVAERVSLLTRVTIAEELAALLTRAISQFNAGSPWSRVSRALDLAPAAPRTIAGLGPEIDTLKQLDEKVLRGRTQDPIGAGVPTGRQRTLIGAHSESVLNNPEYLVEPPTDLGNNMIRANLSRVIRSDRGQSANAVANGTPGNVVEIAMQAVNSARSVANGTQPPRGPPPSAATYQRWADTRLKQYQDEMAAVGQQYAACTNAAAEVNAAAALAGQHPNAAARVDAFVEAVTTMFATAQSAVGAAYTLDQNGARGARDALRLAVQAFEASGPVMSTRKTSTIVRGWTEDQILEAGHLTAQVTPMLLSHGPNHNPPNGATNVKTKHQRLVNGIVWVVLKENVTFNRGPGGPQFTGGRVTSSFPAGLTAIPNAPVWPTLDNDGYTSVPPAGAP